MVPAQGYDRDSRGEPSFTYGIEELDLYLRNALKPGTTILIAGYPGAGKTTFAATICYKNAIRGLPCLYVSFGEQKDSFMEHMLSLGMDFYSLEERRLFKFIKLPLIPSKDSIDRFIEIVGEQSRKLNARVIVVDGITPLIEMFENKAMARAFLQTVLYDFPRLMGGILVLVADIPIGKKCIDAAGIEFVSDIIFVMKYATIMERPIRIMEIRKVRTLPSPMIEIPYNIDRRHGIRVMAPQIIMHGRKVRESSYKLGVKNLDDAVGLVKPGDHVTVIVEPEIGLPAVLYKLFARFIVENCLKAMIFNYRGIEGFMDALYKGFTSAGYDENIFKRHVIGCYEIDPTRTSFYEAFMYESEQVARHNPDIVIFNYPEIMYEIVLLLPRSIRSKYMSMLYNRIAAYRNMGVIAINIVSDTNKKFMKMISLLSDITIKISYGYERGKPIYRITVSRPGYEPRTFNLEKMVS